MIQCPFNQPLKSLKHCPPHALDPSSLAVLWHGR